jgi:hypothetical protein
MIYAFGDMHGDMEIRMLNTEFFPEGKTLTKNDYVIILGDFGLHFDPVKSKTEIHWLKWLASRQWTTLFVDGNHENHDILDNLETTEMFGGEVGLAGLNKEDSIYHLKRGEIYTIDNKKYFVMGGAYSVDKNNRTPNIDWWAREEPSVSEVNHAIDNLEKHNWTVDFILTHTGPSSALNIILGKYANDSMFGNKLIKDSTVDFHDMVQEKAKYDKWLFGHMHEDITVGKETCLYDCYLEIIPMQEQKEQMEAHFQVRTATHIKSVMDNAIKLVQKNPSLAELLEQVEHHDASKYEEPEYSNYLYISWHYKMKKEGIDYKIPDEIDDHIATYHHVNNNKHHPEYWDDETTLEVINREDRHKPSEVMVDGSKMPPISLAEMACDWSAVAQELGTDVYEWGKNNINVRWKFDQIQENFIYECLDHIWDN